MQTRIRYKKNVLVGQLVSKPLLAGTRLLVVTIKVEDSSFVITDSETGTVLSQGVSKTLTKAKLAAKIHLKEHGVSFNDEVRQRKTKEVLENVA